MDQVAEQVVGDENFWTPLGPLFDAGQYAHLFGDDSPRYMLLFGFFAL